jgi:hypothetical protein
MRNLEPAEISWEPQEYPDDFFSRSEIEQLQWCLDVWGRVVRAADGYAIDIESELRPSWCGYDPVAERVDELVLRMINIELPDGFDAVWSAELCPRRGFRRVAIVRVP